MKLIVGTFLTGILPAGLGVGSAYLGGFIGGVIGAGGGPIGVAVGAILGVIIGFVVDFYWIGHGGLDFIFKSSPNETNKHSPPEHEECSDPPRNTREKLLGNANDPSSYNAAELKSSQLSEQPKSIKTNVLGGGPSYSKNPLSQKGKSELEAKESKGQSQIPKKTFLIPGTNLPKRAAAQIALAVSRKKIQNGDTIQIVFEDAKYKFKMDKNPVSPLVTKTSSPQQQKQQGNPLECSVVSKNNKSLISRLWSVGGASDGVASIASALQEQKIQLKDKFQIFITNGKYILSKLGLSPEADEKTQNQGQTPPRKKQLLPPPPTSSLPCRILGHRQERRASTPALGAGSKPSVRAIPRSASTYFAPSPS